MHLLCDVHNSAISLQIAHESAGKPLNRWELSMSAVSSASQRLSHLDPGLLVACAVSPQVLVQDDRVVMEQGYDHGSAILIIAHILALHAVLHNALTHMAMNKLM